MWCGNEGHSKQRDTDRSHSVSTDGALFAASGSRSVADAK